MRTLNNFHKNVDLKRYKEKTMLIDLCEYTNHTLLQKFAL